MRHCFRGKQEQSTPGLEYCLGGFQLCGFCKSTLASLNFGFPIDNIKQTNKNRKRNNSVSYCFGYCSIVLKRYLTKET